MPDTNDCAVYAVAFSCHVTPADAGFYLWRAGRNIGDGATDRQISKAVRWSDHRLRRVKTDAKTIRSFARSNPSGTFLVATTGHVVAVVDGYVCHRPFPEHSDLYRIEKIHKVSRIQ